MHPAVDARRVRFAKYEADVRTAELFKHGIRIKIQDQPFEILAMLLERPGQIVSREELRVRLWANNTFVDFDAGLNAAVRRLRDVLDDSPEQPRYIETIPRRGYRFIAPVETVETAKADREASTEKIETHTETAVAREGVATEAGTLWAKLLWAAAAVAAFVLLALGIGSWRSRFFSANASAKIRSIAVCPLRNVTGDPQRDFFVEGMTQAVITELAQVRSLKVISGPSAAEVKQSNLPLGEIGKRLNVDALLEGSVLQSGARVRIAVRLIEVPGERCRWAKEYNRDERDILNLETEVARDVAAEVSVQLGPSEDGRFRQTRVVNPEAYEKYLEGQYLWRKRTVKSLYGSVEYFQKAAQIDPSWAQAYAGLAEAYAILGYGVMVELSPHEAAAKARAYAIRAEGLDATLAAPHAVLGLIKHRHDWDWSGAEAEFRKAIELDPSYASAYYWYSNYFMTLSRLNSEEVQLAVARRLDPTYPLFYVGVAGNLDRSGLHDEAISVWKQAIHLEDENWGAHYDLAQSYEQVGQYDEAMREMNRALEISAGNVRVKGVMARLYAETGKEVEARAILKEIQGRTNSAFSMAEVYVALGDKEQALNYLRQAMKERCGWVVFMKVLPSLGPLRSDMRYQEMLAEINFPEK